MAGPCCGRWVRACGDPTRLCALTQGRPLGTVLRRGAPALNGPHDLTQILPAATGVGFCGPGPRRSGARHQPLGVSTLGAGAGGDGARVREGEGVQAWEGSGLTVAVCPGPWLGGRGDVTVCACLAPSRPQAPPGQASAIVHGPTVMSH